MGLYYISHGMMHISGYSLKMFHYYYYNLYYCTYLEVESCQMDFFLVRSKHFTNHSSFLGLTKVDRMTQICILQGQVNPLPGVGGVIRRKGESLGCNTIEK